MTLYRMSLMGAALALLMLFATPVAAQSFLLNKSAPAAPAAAAAVVEPLTEAQIDQLLSGLTDAQARDLLRSQLKSVGGDAAAEDVGDGVMGLLDAINEKPALIGKALANWLRLAEDTPRRVTEAINKTTGDRGTGYFLALLATIVGLIIVAGAIDWGFGRLIYRVRVRLRDKVAETAAAKCGRMIAVTILDLVSLGVFVVASILLFRLFIPAPPDVPVRLIALVLVGSVAIVRLTGIVSRFFLAPYIPNIRIAYMTDEAACWTNRWLQQIAAVIALSVGIQGLVTVLNLGEPDFRAMIASVISLLMLAVLIIGIWQRRAAVAGWLRGEGRIYRGTPPSGNGARAGVISTQLADVWHVLASVYVVTVFVVFIVNGLTSGEVRPIAVLASLVLVPAVPILDAAARHVVEALVLAGEKREFRQTAVPQETQNLPPNAEDSTLAAAPAETVDEAEQEPETITGYHPLAYVGHRVFRVALVILSAFVMLEAWGLDVVSGIQSQMSGSAGKSVFQFVVALGIGYVVWEFINAFTKPHMPIPGTAAMDEDGGRVTHNRLETLMPLIRSMLLTALLVVIAMILLSSFGVDIGPLLAGAGVIGIALGFGAQKLVADVISGIFFLIDDAFRVGEYVDTGSVKGTVENISVRSLQLRHHRGALHTIPFGEIRHLTNYHRDWAIVKMEFRVPYDTDIEKVRKIIKKQGQEMLENPVWGQFMLAPLKSQGVARMEDSAMIVRAKFTAVPGEQFVIRREAYRRIQEALQQNGIEFAQRRVTVELASGEEIDTTNDVDGSRVMAAAGGAATAAIAADEGPANPAADTR